MQSTLNRSIIHEDFHHMPSGMRYDDFMKEIDDKLKRKKSHLTVVITKNNKKSLNNYHSH